MLLGVDVGGTFTDAVLVDGRGTVFTAKVPSTPGRQQVGVMAAVEAVLFRAGAAPREVRRFAHGMTVATNALLEGRGARTALMATEGFTDVVELARQTRPSLYRLCEAPPAPLVGPELRFAVPERMTPDGPLRALTRERAAELLDELERARPQAVAVALLHSYAHPEHERMLGRLIRERMPQAHVSLSHELVGTFREYERAATTELDAALSPLLSSYLDGLGERARAEGLPDVQVMQSSGGLTDAPRAGAHAALTVLSGPAGGACAALLLSAAGGVRDVLCFDMGGTSCDVCVVSDGALAETAERTVAGRPLALPALDIHTVGAGGGSIAWLDRGGALRVGPASAGADPGPACYGRGGREPTVTDANVLLGRIPAGVPLAGGVRLEADLAERAVARLASDAGLDTKACAEGIVRVAESEMLRALRVMTVERGVDPRGFALMPFGGAGPLHAVSMATQLGIRRVLCPRASGVLSALGLAGAAPRHDAAATVMLSGEALAREPLARELGRLRDAAAGRLDGPLARAKARFELRYAGQSFELAVERELAVDEPPEEDPQRLREAFGGAHEERYGYRDDQAEIELVNVRVSAIGAAPRLTLAGAAGGELAAGHDGGRPAANGSSERPGARVRPETTEAVFDGERRSAALWRGEIPPGAEIEGPAICAMPESTLVVPPGWSGTADEHGTIVLERAR